MTVRILRAKQRGPWCSYCEGDKQRATHRGLGFIKFACAEHLGTLIVQDKLDMARDSYQTEGEYQALRYYR